MNIKKRPYVTLLAMVFAFHATSALAGVMPISDSSGIKIAGCGNKVYLKVTGSQMGYDVYKIMNIDKGNNWENCCNILKNNPQLYTPPNSGSFRECRNIWLEGMFIAYTFPPAKRK
ncbi:MAG: hypothetical protein ABI041_15335 [Bdellovibrionia bacterium]